MAKQGMKRPEDTPEKKKKASPVSEIKGKAKNSKEKAKPIIACTEKDTLKVYHQNPFEAEKEEDMGVFDNDLARENLENNIPEADLQDLH